MLLGLLLKNNRDAMMAFIKKKTPQYQAYHFDFIRSVFCLGEHFIGHRKGRVMPSDL